MRLVCLFAAIFCTTIPVWAAANPCTNGSFEELDARGFPVDWQAVGARIETADDAHSGQHAVRLVRTVDDAADETGLNRAYSHGTEGGGAMIDQRRGGIEFWYNAVSADSAELSVYAIPMSADGVEKTGSLRATFTVPPHHIGDGHWHQARLKYDFTENANVHWIQFAARIVGSAGELLLDDFSYLEQVGVVLRVSSVRLEEDAEQPGQRCVVRAKIENAGDAVAEDIRAAIDLPEGLTSNPREVRIDRLAADHAIRASWTVDGRRAKSQSLGVTASFGDLAASGRLKLQSGLVIRSFGPVAPVVEIDKPAVIQCVLENTGQVPLENISCEFTLSSATSNQTIDSIPPGSKKTVRADFLPQEQSPRVQAAVQVQMDGSDPPLSAQSTLCVGSAKEVADTGDRLRAVVDDDYAILGNRYVRLMFRRNAFGFGPGELSVAKNDDWQTVAWLPRLSRLVSQRADGKPMASEIFTLTPPEVIGTPPQQLRFQWNREDDDGTYWNGTVTFALESWSKEIRAEYELSCNKPARLLAFEGPMLYALDRDEAVFPGLEWLVGDEISSASLDIAQDHADRLRYVVHPNKITVPAVSLQSKAAVVGMYWDVHQQWDGQRDRPSVVFASPDRFENQPSHLVGLFLPTVPEFVDENSREAARPYALKAGQTLRLEATLFADAGQRDVLAGVQRWIEAYGIPEPAPLPRESYEREIEFSMQAYLTSLWEPREKQWWTTKGDAIMSKTGRPRAFVADLMTAALITDDAVLRRRYLARAEDVRALLGGDARLDAQRFPNRADLAYANPAAVSPLLATRAEDGTWRFDANQRPQEGPFVGRDYGDLGPDGALELGTCARNAYETLRYARISGDAEAYEQMLKPLAQMESFRVPRAAQVWEIPVHAPDLLAAADAVDAFVEAHRFSGEQRWLKDATQWAKRGLPFIYLWNDPDKPYLQGGSIPVFGATWHRGSWFGRMVQWNGLRYAVALLRLSEYDDSYPWRQIAEVVIRSAILQQERRGENVALWPDAISAIDGEKSAWIFGPHQIMDAVFRLVGRDPEPTTVMVGYGQQRVHVTAVGTIVGAAHKGRVLSVDVEYPANEQGIVLMSNISRPDAVFLDGTPIRERIDIEQWDEPSWRYDAGNAYLAVRVTKDGPSRIRADGVDYRKVRRLPWMAEEIAFDFDDSLDGWLPANHISELVPVEGSLFGRISGPDPYLVRQMIHVQGDDCPILNLRMRVTVGSEGQIYWTTEESPEFDEDKSIQFKLVPDGRFHDYRFEVGQHPMWAGQTITGLRLDPCNGAGTGEFNVNSLRTEMPAVVGPRGAARVLRNP